MSELEPSKPPKEPNCKYFYHDSKWEECTLMTLILRQAGAPSYHALLGGLANRSCLGSKEACLFKSPQWHLERLYYFLKRMQKTEAKKTVDSLKPK